MMSDRLNNLIQENAQIVKARQELQDRVKEIKQYLKNYLEFYKGCEQLSGMNQELKQLNEQIEILILKQQDILNEMEKEYAICDTCI